MEKNLHLCLLQLPEPNFDFDLNNSSMEMKPPTPKFGEEKVNLAKLKFIFKNKQEKNEYIESLEFSMRFLKQFDISSGAKHLERL